MNNNMIITRFAPSPTGYLHLGGARTALFCWLYAKQHHGKFILRIEDTDIQRSTKESVTSILDAMQWLGLTYDQDPIYQTNRMSRYQQMITQLLNNKQAYYCYCSKEELDIMREIQRSKGEKPKYNRKCLSCNTHPNNINPVVRFKNPQNGYVVWDDVIKGEMKIANSELDDLIIMRSDGVPTYNFCVVIDDLDMNISHVIRGDDHINNTPRQINIFRAFSDNIPIYAHIPMILRDDGQKMSKRRDAVSVMQYKDMGILPQALLNYLSRLCWSHGNEEIFTIDKLLLWFDLNNVSSAAARFDMSKLLWVNAEHIKLTSNYELVKLLLPYFEQKQITIKDDDISLLEVVELMKYRVNNLNDLFMECKYFYDDNFNLNDDSVQYINTTSWKILNKFNDQIQTIIWNIDEIKNYIKLFCIQEKIKMPELAMPLRVQLCGTTHTPSIDKIIFLMGREKVLHRLTKNASYIH